MKIVVQNCLTKEYLTEEGTRDAIAAKAKVFDRNLAAFEHCRLHSIPHAEVVLKFDEPQFDVRMPVSKSCKDQRNGGKVNADELLTIAPESVAVIDIHAPLRSLRQ